MCDLVFEGKYFLCFHYGLLLGMQIIPSIEPHLYVLSAQGIGKFGASHESITAAALEILACQTVNTDAWR